MPRWIGCVVGVLTACAAPSSAPAPTAPIAAAAPTTIDATAAPTAATTAPRPPDPDDVLPSDHSVAPPDAELAIELPDGVTVAPPADGWWKRRSACPKGTRLNSHVFTFRPGSRWRAHRCVGTTTAARPESSIRLDVAGDREDSWVDADGKRHGGYRMIESGYETAGLWLHGVEHGRHTHTEVAKARLALITPYRDGTRHGLYLQDNSSLPQTGYYVDGHRVGSWLQWRSLDGVVRSRLRYDAGVLHGAQRWWYPDGAVLARAALVAGVGTWEVLRPDGRVRSRVDCNRAELVELVAWDQAGTVVLRTCGPNPPRGCVAVGPTTYREGVPLGAAPQLCDDPSIAPLGVF